MIIVLMPEMTVEKKIISQQDNKTPMSEARTWNQTLSPA